MAVRNCKDVTYVAATVLLSAFLVAAQCENATTATKSSDPAHSPGLERIKPLTSMKNPNAPAENLNEHMSSNEKMDEDQKRIQTEDESENLTNNHADNMMVTVGSQKKVNSHEPESRSNSSSAESVEVHASTHPLFANRHQEDASGTAALENPDSNSNSEIVHEHVEKYQLHQSSEQDSDEDASFKAPTTTSGGAHGKVSDSMMVSSDPFPVRLESNGKGSVSNNNNGISAIRKPLPIVRQEAAQTHVSGTHENIHDRYRL